MTSTTIKVSSELRDRLKARAAASGHTMSEHLEVLLADEARRERFRQLRESLARTPPDAEYEAEARAWQADSWS